MHYSYLKLNQEKKCLSEFLAHGIQGAATGIWGLPHMRELGPNLNSQAHLPVHLEASSKQPCPEKCWLLQAIPCSLSGLRGPPLYSEQHQGRCWLQTWLQTDVLIRLQWQPPLLKLQPSSTTVQPQNSKLITTFPESPTHVTTVEFLGVVFWGRISPDQWLENGSWMWMMKLRPSLSLF